MLISFMLSAFLGLYGHQAQFMQARATHIGMVGGYGSGKSFTIGAKALQLAAVNAGLPGMIVEPSHRMAKDIMIPTLNGILRDAGVKFHYAKSDAKYILQNHSEIWLRSADNPNSLVGPTLAWCLLDEADLMDADAWVRGAVSRVRHPQAKQLCKGLATTAEGLGWVHQLFKIDHVDDPAYFLLEGVNTKANRSLPPDYLKSLLENMTPDQVAAYVEGRMQPPTEGRVFPPFNRDVHLVDCPIDKRALRMIGMDFNVHPATAEVFQMYQGAPVIVDYYTLPNASTQELGQKILTDYPMAANVPLCVDHTGNARNHATGHSDVNILKQLGFQNIKSKATKNVRDKFNHINVMLKDATGNVRLRVAKHCTPRKHREFPSVVECLENAMYNDKHTDFDDPLYSHTPDGVAYALMNEYPIKRPLPPILPSGVSAYA